MNCGKFWKRWEYQTTWPASWETYMQVRKQQLELDMEQQTGSKLGKGYVKAVYCHPNYLTYMQNMSPGEEKGNTLQYLAWRIPWRAKSWHTGKDPDAGKDWRQEEKGTTEDEIVGWHHRLNGHEFEQTMGVGEGQGCLACCSPWGCKESDMTERLNNNKGN